VNTDRAANRPIPTAWVVFVLLGGYLTLNGYRSFEGDQAYRLPLLLHQQDPALYAADPFVRAFDSFNPHRGYLAILDATSRLLGLPAALFGVFALTFAALAVGIRRLALATWPGHGQAVGWVALGLLLTARAGNIGTNHLFEPMLLDRLMAYALGWLALAEIVRDDPRAWWRPALLLAAAQLIHPSLGMQLAALSVSSWIALAMLGRWTRIGWRNAATGSGLIVALQLPGLIAVPGQSAVLFRGMDVHEFMKLAAYVQSPQHMIPHLWRLPQWLAWFGYLFLAGLSARGPDVGANPARRRLLVILGVNLLGLAVAAWAIEGLHNPRVTLFQPFRLATVARGLCLVIISGRVVGLWERGSLASRVRAGILVAGLTGDWAMVVAVAVELSASAAARLVPRFGGVMLALALAIGLVFLSRVDPEMGHAALLAAVGIATALSAAAPRLRAIRLDRPRCVRIAAYAWLVPLLAWGLGLAVGPTTPAPTAWLVAHCRLVERPNDDIERLAVWCREHTPVSARFVGPPGPKGFRLWSRRSLAFNRASSPYHATGLDDWAVRFRDHVDLHGDGAALARAYLADRHGLERRYDQLDPDALAALAARQGADHVIAGPFPNDVLNRSGRLEALRHEGAYVAYRVRPGRSIAQARRDSPRRRLE
jgi:hypothetical protein